MSHTEPIHESEVPPEPKAETSGIELFADLNAGEADRRVARLDLFFGESPEVVRRLVANRIEPTQLLVSDRRHGFLDSVELNAVEVTVLPETDLYRLVGFEMHRGVIGLFRRPPAQPTSALAGVRRVAVIEGLNDHNNLGSIIRSGVGLGIGGFVLDPTSADPFARRSVRVSMGTVGSVPIVVSRNWPQDLFELEMDAVVALSPSGGDRLGDLPQNGPMAIMVGAEGSGLTTAALALATHTCAIPMQGGLDSLNVSHAAAIAFHHFMPLPGDGSPGRAS